VGTKRPEGHNVWRQKVLLTYFLLPILGILFLTQMKKFDEHGGKIRQTNYFAPPTGGKIR
jgi:sorbitol-specific phosphotransferase system component IIC